MRQCLLVILVLAITSGCHTEKNLMPECDLYADTWVATDALGRSMPSRHQVGEYKKDKKRTVGIFYVSWHNKNNRISNEGYTADVSKILEQYPEARNDGQHPAWQKGYHHWGEPEMGYFLSDDPWVIRKDMSMLADAGVDVIIMDATNAVMYWKEWETTFAVMQQMKAEGNKVPQFCFWAFNGPVISVVQQLYEKIYKQKRYKELWFYWEDKPLILWNDNPMQDATRNTKNRNLNHNFDSLAISDPQHPHYGDPDYTQQYYTDYTQEVKVFFTSRMMWWGYHRWKGKPYVGTEGHWSFGYDLGRSAVRNKPAIELVAPYKGTREQAAVTPAQHSVSAIGKSWSREYGQPKLDDKDMPLNTYVPWLDKVVDQPSGYGIYFQERWDEAIAADPSFIYINDWNEWTAIKFRPEQLRIKQKDGKAHFLNSQRNFVFVDQYNAEFNRTVQPMKGGYSDNYYMQMAQNIRRYKGVRAIPVLNNEHTIKINGRFADWGRVETEYRDTRGDVLHRHHKGFGNRFYSNTSGRNDIVKSKVAVSATNVAFYVQTAQKLTPCTDDKWMILLIDADQNYQTGWQGYDYMIKDYDTKARLYQYKKNHWLFYENVAYAYKENELELSISRQVFGIKKSSFSFDFKWADNPGELSDFVTFFNNGDTAPNRRFNYRCIVKF